MSDATVNVPELSNGVGIDNTVIQRNGARVYRQRVEVYAGDTLPVDTYEALPVTFDASLRHRVSQITTLFDGKTLRQEDTFLWDTKGTGTTTFVNGAINSMTVTAGQYEVRQGKTYTPYFSGKSQMVEITFDTFGVQSGVTKRLGYFSSSATAPYSANFDGWFLESSDTIYLVVVNNGTEVLRKPIAEWDGYAALASYNWNNFTVVLADFLWLGGAVLRLFVKNPSGGFTLAHTFDFAGSATGVFMRSPQQPVRYEIRSTSGAGTLRCVCSQVATEGAIAPLSKSLSLWHSTLVPANNVGTIYAVKGVKKRAGFRDIPVEIDQFGGAMTATADAGAWMLLQNPTLSAPLVYTQNGVLDEATATNQTVTNAGRVLATVHASSAGVSVPISGNQLAWMGVNIDDVPDEYVLAYLSLTSNQSVNGAITVQVY